MTMEEMDRKVRIAEWIDAIRDVMIGLTAIGGLFIFLTQMGMLQ